MRRLDIYGGSLGVGEVQFVVTRNISRSNEHKISFKKLSKWNGYWVGGEYESCVRRGWRQEKGSQEQKRISKKGDERVEECKEKWRRLAKHKKKMNE